MRPASNAIKLVIALIARELATLPSRKILSQTSVLKIKSAYAKI